MKGTCEIYQGRDGAEGQGLCLRPVVREVGKVVIRYVQKEDQNDVLNTKRCLSFLPRVDGSNE